MKLKQRIKDLDEAVNMVPLFITLARQELVETISTLGTTHRIRKVAHFLNGVKYYIYNNISERLNIFEDVWEIAYYLRNLPQIISSFID